MIADLSCETITKLLIFCFLRARHLHPRVGGKAVDRCGALFYNKRIKLQDSLKFHAFEVMLCRNCGEAPAEGQRFCPKCGTPTGCPKCGSPIAPGSAFCGNCGAALGGGGP
ncbi:MAG: zinc ribbon domain-containing protein [Clostridia bacterium]|nr:zinc ribbon domain-containing protein [Clostridia bacterium]